MRKVSWPVCLALASMCLAAIVASVQVVASPPSSGQEAAQDAGFPPPAPVRSTSVDHAPNASTVGEPEWVLTMASPSPPTRWGHAMAYDESRHRVVLFGGETDAGPLADTWEWDGGAWVIQVPATSPPARFGAAMVYDASRRRMVLFGGFGSSYPDYALADTWEWDGSIWVERTPATSPPARWDHAMAYDSRRERVVLFGGSRWGGVDLDLNDTWEWDGNAWSQVQSPLAPPAQSGPVMAYDSARGRVVLFGYSADSNGSGMETWEWDGNDWMHAIPALSPPRSGYSAMVYDRARARTVLFTTQGSPYRSDTWEWDGSAWEKESAETGPPTFDRTAMAYDEDRAEEIVFDRATTWGWDGSKWETKSPAVSPPVHWDPVMAYDSSRNVMTLFGATPPELVFDTWEWDGRTWIERSPATTKPASPFGAMAYDRARGRTVLYGSGARPLGSTWEWDGTDWSEKTPATGPPSREGHAMAYDEARQRVVLFGGWNSSLSFLSDTWEWDGTVWRERTPAVSPTPRDKHRMIYDRVRERVILFGGRGLHVGALADTWEWDGESWIERRPAAHPSARSLPVMAYDGLRRRVILFGGSQGTQYPALTDTWAYGTLSSCAHATRVVSSNPGTGGSTSFSNVLGAPDGQTASLGFGGQLVLLVDPPVESGPGTDFIVYASGASAGGIDENYRVEVSKDNRAYVFVRDCPGGECHLDLTQTGLESAPYVRITDLPPQEAGAVAPTAGADIDAVTAIQVPDRDVDGVADVCDNCPSIYNPDQTDICDVASMFASANLSTDGFSADRIDGRDLFVFANAYGLCPWDPAYNSVANLDRVPAGAGACVDAEDLHIFLNEFGRSM